MKKVLVRAGTVLTAIVLSLLVANPATAYNDAMNTDDGYPGGRVEVAWYGDIVTVCDWEKDGWGVYLRVIDISQDLFKYEVIVRGGRGTCVTKRASQGGPYNLKEDNYFEFKLCLRKETQDGVTLAYCDYAAWKNWQ